MLVDELFDRIKEFLFQYKNVLELPKKTPSCSTRVVEDLMAETELNMSHFLSEKHLASWAGMCPGNNERDDKKAKESLMNTSK
ncbi:MAG: transposase [Christensenellaceae bacterium]